MTDGNIAICIKKLSKTYASSGSALLWDRLLQRKVKGTKVLEGISFDVKMGTCLGVVGLNGAGKSTLLQLLTGILSPTSGKITLNGKLSAILELGSGFEKHFTGKENIELYSRIMGFTAKELLARESEIKDFAELGDYYEKPLRTYSSGMVARLAFAVRAFLNFDILILDEVLAVGDAYFQRKCLRLLDDLKDKGKTIVFVSHSINQVLEICDEAVLLNEGRLEFKGSPKDCIYKYFSIINEKKTGMFSSKHDARGVPRSYGQGGAELIECFSTEKKVGQRFVFGFGCMAEITFRIGVNTDLKDAIFGLVVKNVSGVVITGENHELGNLESGEVVSVKVSLECLINPGTYFLSCGLKSKVRKASIFQFRDLDFKEVEIIDENLDKTSPYNGMVSLVKEVSV